MQCRLALRVTEPSRQSSSPDQPAKLEPMEGVAENAMTAPSPSAAAQTLPQSIAAGRLVTVPAPLPALATLRHLGANGGAGRPGTTLMPEGSCPRGPWP